MLACFILIQLVLILTVLFGAVAFVSLGVSDMQHTYNVNNNLKIPRGALEFSTQKVCFKFYRMVAAKAWGDPCGIPVLCVHGIQDNADSFTNLIPLLSRLPAFYFVCVDLPGHGLSSPFPKGIPLHFLEYTLSLIRVMDCLEWKKCCYLGHSLGGQMGIYLCALWPHRITRIVVLDAIAPFSTPTSKYTDRIKEQHKKLLELEEKLSKRPPPSYTYEEAVHRLIENRPSKLTENSAKVLITRSLVQKPDGTFYFTTDQRLKYRVWPLLNMDQVMQVLSEIRCPMLFVLSDARRFAEAFKPFKKLLEWYATWENFDCVDVEGSHDVHMNNPERVAPYVIRFLMQQRSFL